MQYKKIKYKKYLLYIADTPKKRHLGLSNKSKFKNISKNQGMIFVYEKEEKDRSFTMRKTNHDLKIIFLNKDKEIVYEEIGKSKQVKLINCKNPSMYVIEIKIWIVIYMGLKVGDLVRFKKIYSITVDDLINKKNYSIYMIVLATIKVHEKKQCACKVMCANGEVNWVSENRIEKVWLL